MDKLDPYLDAAAQLGAFHWSRNNCAQFAGGWVRIRTGRDPLTAWDELARGDTRRALRRLRDEGGYASITDKVLGRRLPGALAARGDVVLVDTGLRRKFFGSAWAICTGSRIAVLTHNGVEMAPAQLARFAWRV